MDGVFFTELAEFIHFQLISCIDFVFFCYVVFVVAFAANKQHHLSMSFSFSSHGEIIYIKAKSGNTTYRS